MDPGLHVKQAINHLNKVLAYYPYVVEDGQATVALTPEDWQVVADALFYMDVAKDVFPQEIREFTMADDRQTMQFITEDAVITVEAG
ncbi:hypothetical protein BH23BAC4_BH23BAC4_00310 [soil metagenome]